MLKHFLVGTLTVSSLAFAAPPLPAHGAVPVVPPPAPRVVPAAPPPPPRAAPIAAPPPPQGAVRFDEVRDTRRASELLRAFDAASARRDMRAIGNLDRQFKVFLDQEQREARMSRNGRVVLNRLNRIESELTRLQGRMNPASINGRRALYAELVGLADGRVGRRF